MKEFLFDITCNVAVRVSASSMHVAKRMLENALDCTTANLGALPNGEPIVGELSLDRVRFSEVVS